MSWGPGGRRAPPWRRVPACPPSLAGPGASDAGCARRQGRWPFPGLPAACPATVPGRRARHESGRNGENGRGAAGAATAVPLELSLARPALAEVLHAQLCSNFTETRGSRARPVAQLSPRGSGRPVSSLRSRGSSAGRRGGARAGGAGPVLGGVPLGAMASSRGCAPAWASSLWLHAASRRRPSLRQAPGAVSDHPRPRGHPALLPSAPPRQGPGLEAALLPRKGACHEAAPHVSGRPDGVPQRRAQKRPVARGAPQPACSAACVRGARVCPRGPRRVSGRTSELRVSHLTWEGRLPRPLVPAALSRGRTGCQLRPLPLVRGPCPGRAPQEAHALPGAPGTPSLPLGTSGVCASSLALRRVQAQASRPLPKARVSASPTPAQHGVPAHSRPGLG